MQLKNKYRSHICFNLKEENIGQDVRVAGWVENIRDHGGVMFLDIRDESGVVQAVVHDDSLLLNVNRECSVSVFGTVILRDEDTINPNIPTGTIEIDVKSLDVLGKCVSMLPFEVQFSKDTKEDVRLKYRYLDLRNPKVHSNIMLRSRVIEYLRQQMQKLGFLEIQTPILSASSPEGARDYIIPSRKHKGKFYALPQAPQIYKQLLMVSGFEKYFQIAPCFRDEDARADRSPGEFYQLDFEMAFATQEDVFEVAQQVLYNTLSEFTDKEISKPPFKRVTYKESMLKYGTDKPDLRNPLEIVDISKLFAKTDFTPFLNKTVRALRVPGIASKSKGFFEKMLNFALSIGMPGLGYVKVNEDMSFDGPIDKFLSQSDRDELINLTKLKSGDVLYFIADTKKKAEIFSGEIRSELAKRLDLIDNKRMELCFITDFPMYELDENGQAQFMHNPFSMPKGAMESLNTLAPEEILAYQYDIVCNGVELSSGAVRNHDIDIMVKAFEIAGYTEEELKNRFGALYNAFKYGAPPHAGMAPGIDRLLMLMSDEENIREVIAFPLNSNAQDYMTGAPGEVTQQQLRDVHIKLR